ncbi:hypothetical protein EG68_06642 [Paragonimus skrjabini miyazakii]|uniref:K Homology domain-containing protein n=1 Tax=Paragonimus skrjabini miyazakii TaxID=59628 RepID=A0A8S9YTY2_9TREM|nr:hypothetical protein EG68_06642 [Paragonimus skrjabini miyazakii]
MIDVEVKGCLGQYIKAVLKNITDTDAIVSYDSRDGEEHVPLSNVRLPPSPAKEALAGHDAEVLFSFADSQTGGQTSGIGGLLSGNWTDDDRSKMDTLPLSGDRYEHLDLPAWWPCRVHKIRDDVAVVKFQINPPPNASPDEVSRCAQLSSVTDIVSLNTLRYPCTDCPPITASMFHRYCIDIPKELSSFASDVSVHSDFLKHCGGPTSVFFDSESSVLIVLSTDEDTIRNVSLLEETHLKMLRQKWAITRSLRQTMRSLEVSRGPDGSRMGLTNSRSSEWEAEPGMVVEKFYVSQRLMGLAIGAHGSNIRAAREIPGVVFIRLLEPHEHARINGDPGVDTAGDCGDSALFIVEAKTAEAAKLARNKLEYTELYLGVPRRYVGRLIGRRTANILSIIRKSGLVQIHFDDHIQGPSDDDTVPYIGNLSLTHSASVVPPPNMRRVFLRAGGSQTTTQPQADEEYGGFILSGTREAVEKARLLISFQLDYIFDLEKMEAEKVALMRNLTYPGPEIGSGHATRGYTDSGRWNDRGSSIQGRGSRGARRPSRGISSNGAAVPGRFADDASASYGSLRRPTRDTRNVRGHNGDSRPRRHAGRGGGGSRRGPGVSRDYSDWHDRTGNNGDVADRRRGSEDSDAQGSNLSQELETEDRNLVDRHGRNNSADRKRITRGGNASSQETDDDHFPGGDGSPAGESGRPSNDTPRVRGSDRSDRHSSEYSTNSNRSRRAGGSVANRHWADNDEIGSNASRTSQLSTGAHLMKQSMPVSGRQPAQV